MYHLISLQQEDSAVEPPEGSWVLARWMRGSGTVRIVLETWLLTLGSSLNPEPFQLYDAVSGPCKLAGWTPGCPLHLDPLALANSLAVSSH